MPTAALAPQRARATLRRSRTHAIAQVLSLSPFLILLAAASDPGARLLAASDAGPVLLGMHAEAVLGGLTVVWMFVGALVVRYARSPLAQSLALLVFTIPATIAAVLASAVILLLVRQA